MPCLLLENISESVNAQSIKDAFASCGAKSVNIIGGKTFQMPVANSAEALKVAHIINDIEVSGVKLMTNVSKGHGEQYSVTVFNIPVTETDANVQNALTSALSGKCDTSKLTSHAAASRTLVMRVSSTDGDKVGPFVESVRKIKGVTVTEHPSIAKPSVFIRNIGHLETVDVENLMQSHGHDRLEIIKKSKDGALDMAVAYFPNMEVAFKCYTALKSTNINGKKLSASYKDTFEPAVVVKNLPANVVEGDIRALFEAFSLSNVVIRDGADGKYAEVLMKSPADAILARSALNKKSVAGNRVSIAAHNIGDIGIEIGVDAAQSVEQETAVEAALSTQGLSPKSIAYQTNISAHISFLTTADATAAHRQVSEGAVDALRPTTPSASKLPIGGSLMSTFLTTSPSFSLSLSQLNGDTSVQEIMAPLPEAFPDSALSILGSDRSALVKFRRHKDVVPGIKAIKKLRLPHAEVEDGVAENIWADLRVQRYRPLTSIERSVDYLPSTTGSDALDEDEDDMSSVTKKFRARSAGVDEEFDQFSLRAVLKDYMMADPATRYELAKNAFERALSDARSTKDPSYLLGNLSSKALKSEVTALIDAPGRGSSNKRQEGGALDIPLDRDATQRLFELFLQREDMAKFTHDFKELTAFFGAADEDDLLSWSQFKADSVDDMQRMMQAIKEKEAEEMENLLRTIQKQKVRSFKEEAVTDSDNYAFDGELVQAAKKGLTIRIEGERKGEKDAVISLAGTAGDANRMDDPNALKDKDGNFWSGCILNSDIVQRVAPGDRVNSQRVLVVVGNMRGAAGFGMGKGKTAADALTGAFRQALRNLTHIDLYDNFGLAHDLHGKHNSCHAYIKATPRSREMVASPFATEILTRFGIGSASVKLVGRRDPYAMVRAMFNALGQHENIDEYAKDRGKRYLTLKWAHDQKL